MQQTHKQTNSGKLTVNNDIHKRHS